MRATALRGSMDGLWLGGLSHTLCRRALATGGVVPHLCANAPYVNVRGVVVLRSRGADDLLRRTLPAVVREGLVRLGHAVRVFLFLDRIALALRCRNHLGGEFLGHRLLVAIA